jgi:hypothetical protein
VDSNIHQLRLGLVYREAGPASALHDQALEAVRLNHRLGDAQPDGAALGAALRWLGHQHEHIRDLRRRSVELDPDLRLTRVGGRNREDDAPLFDRHLGDHQGAPLRVDGSLVLTLGGRRPDPRIAAPPSVRCGR